MKTAVLNLIMCLIAGVLIFFAGAFWTEWQRYSSIFNEAKDARPLDIEVDFSKPGLYRSVLNNTFQNAHSITLGLELPKDTLSKEDLKISEGSLEAKCSIADAKGNMMFSENLPFTGGRLSKPVFENTVFLADLPEMSEGGYSFEVAISKGDEKLLGIKQRLVARYELCGLELLPGSIARAISIAFSVIGILILIFVAVKKKKHTVDEKAKPIES